MKLNVTDQDRQTHVIEGTPGTSLMEAILDSGLEIAAQCGGCCSCATCHVYIADDWLTRLSEPDEEETEMLELAIEVTDSSRLSCQIQLTDNLNGLDVKLAPGSRV